MIETCEQLTQHVRRNLGSSNALAGMKVHEQHGFLSFRWYERDFAVKRSLEVFEIKGQNLFVTGASMLMQTVLRRAETDSSSVEGIVNSIRTAEDLIADEQQRNSGFKLLSNIKAALKKLACTKDETSHPGSAGANGASSNETAPPSAGRVEPATVH